MTVSIRFTMIGGRFSGSLPPSPGRALGALLAGAYRSGEQKALDAVRSLSDLPQPDIHVPESRGGFDAWTFCERQVDWDYGTKAGGPVKDAMSKIGKRAAHTVVDPSAVIEFVTEGEADLEGLSLAARHVAHFGKGTDLALAAVDDAPRRGGRRYVPCEGAGTALREWSPSLIDWYDDQYAAVHVRADAPSFRPDARVRTGRWAQVRIDSDGNGRVAIPTVRPLDQAELPRLLAAVDADDPLAMVDQNGRVRGVSVRPESGIGVRTRLLDPAAVPLLACQDPARWTGPAPRWVSATPVSAHPDARVAAWQIARSGVEVLRLSRTPLRRSQPHRNLPAPRSGNTRWWADVRPAPDQPHSVGDDLDAGFGLLRPIHEDRP